VRSTGAVLVCSVSTWRHWRQKAIRNALCWAVFTFSQCEAPGAARADLSQYLFGLSGDNTAYDYMAAPVDRAVKWLMTMCNNGECLRDVDWHCGFDNNDDLEKVEDCFTSLVGQVPPWVKLDQIRKFCGVRLAQFIRKRELQWSGADEKKCADRRRYVGGQVADLDTRRSIGPLPSSETM
jgi:hypothetical protein